MKERIARYIAHDLLNEPTRIIADDEDLLGSGLIDSMSVMSLVHFIEEELRYSVPPEDLLIENFGSLATIEAYLSGRSTRAV